MKPLAGLKVTEDQDVDDEPWWREYLRGEADRKLQLEAFAQAVSSAMEREGVFEVRSQFERQGGRIVIHGSTRPGIAYQVTFIDREGPSGHSDARSLDAAIKRAWEDVHPDEKAAYP